MRKELDKGRSFEVPRCSCEGLLHSNVLWWHANLDIYRKNGHQKEKIFSLHGFTWILISAYITIRNIWSRSAWTDLSDCVELIEEREVHMKMKYTVTWKETSSPFEKRMEKYFGDSSLPYIWEIRWFSILNSCVTILFLTGQISMYYLWILKKDLE